MGTERRYLKYRLNLIKKQERLKQKETLVRQNILKTKNGG